MGSRPMKVALVTSAVSTNGGGVATVVEAASAALQCRGLDVQVFGLSDAKWLREDVAAWKGAPVRAYQTRGPRAFGYAPGMLRDLTDWSPDIAHTHGLWMYPSRCVTQWAARTGKPHIVSPHGMLSSWARRRSRWKKAIARALYEGRHLQTAARLQALCAPEYDDIRAAGVKAKITQIPNGIERVVHPVTEPAPWVDTISPDKNVMLFLGRLSPQKNLLPFLQCWKDATEDGAGRDWHLAIAGWDQFGYERALRGEVAALRIEDRVTFLGPIFGARKAAAYANADAFVLPSVSEGLPMSVLEAWAHGCPVLMTDACNIPEGFAAGAAYKICTNRTSQRINLHEFLRSPVGYRISLAKAGQKLIEDRFDWDRVAEQLQSTYEECVSE